MNISSFRIFLLGGKVLNRVSCFELRRLSAFCKRNSISPNSSTKKIEEILNSCPESIAKVRGEVEHLDTQDIESTITFIENMKMNRILDTTLKEKRLDDTELLKSLEKANIQESDKKILIELLKSPLKDVLSYRDIIKTSGRKIVEFADLIECSTLEACRDFKKYKFLIQSRISTLREKLLLICDKGGVSKEDVKRDLWVLSYTKSRLEGRLKVLKGWAIDSPKPWMLRCPDKTLNRSWKNRSENAAAMAPHKSCVDFLCKRLSVNENQVEAFAAKHPPVMRVQMVKLKEMIDFLMSEGFSATQIYNTPRILCHSKKTVQSRLAALYEKRYEPHSLSIICLSTREFAQFLKRVSHKTK